MIMARSIG
jgi:hypothetical protein